MQFESIVDWWYYLLILAMAIVLMFAAIRCLQAGRPAGYASLAILLACLLMPVWLLFSTHYRVSAETLVVESGPFYWNIPLAEITSLRRSRSSRSGPALSLNRIEIKYGGGQSILISPKNPQAFILAMARAGVNQ